MAEIRKVRWWERYIDPQQRYVARRWRKTQRGEIEMVEVGRTLGGAKIMVAWDMVGMWHEMDAESKSEFLNAIDEHKRQAHADE